MDSCAAACVAQNQLIMKIIFCGQHHRPGFPKDKKELKVPMEYWEHGVHQREESRIQCRICAGHRGETSFEQRFAGPCRVQQRWDTKHKFCRESRLVTMTVEKSSK